MSLRLEFVSLANVEGANMRDLCRRFGINHNTGYKWLQRFRQGGAEALHDHSRRPQTSPNCTSQEVEQAILQLREEHPAWGPRKIKALLPQDNQSPAVSTIAIILKRNGKIDPAESPKHKSWQRFEAESPNAQWQMDFKGHFPLLQGGRCHPLTVLDDHSRFLVALRACRHETEAIVQNELTSAFRLYGLPKRMIMDNGAPWGHSPEHPYTPLTVWLIRLGISVGHSRPRHPQTNGKDERLHRTLNSELITRTVLLNISDSQKHFDPWRDTYNCQRPHEALGMATPASRYHPSPREFPEVLPAIKYDSPCATRKVQEKGELSFKGREIRVPRAFRGYTVGICATTTDDLYELFFCHQRIGIADLRSGKIERTETVPVC